MYAEPESVSDFIEVLRQHALPRLGSLTLGFELAKRLSEALRAIFGHAGLAQSLK